MGESSTRRMTQANVLLVDDLPANLLALRVVLEDLDVNLVEARSGHEALKRSLDQEFAVILLDVQMHDMDGFETAKLIRSREKSRHTPIIFLTAFDSNRLTVAEAYSLGAVDYMVKPLVPEILKAKVAGFIELFQKSEQIKRQAEQISELQRREFDRALHEEREWFRVTLSSIGDAVLTTDTEGRLTFLNPVAESLTGWTQAEAKGVPLKKVFTIIHEESRQTVDNPALRALREGRVIGLATHTVLIAKDGSEHPIDDSAAPIRDDKGQVVGSVLVFRDITERRRAERQNAERLLTARTLAAIVESSEDAIIGKTLDGIITSWNAAAERLFGYTAAQAVGRHISFIIPADRANEEAQILEYLRAGKPVDHLDTVRLRSDSQSVEVSLTISPIRDEAGRVVGASKIVRDITDRKQAEERAYRLTTELKEADRRKDEFLATLAHELRGPLAPLCNLLDIIKRADKKGNLLPQVQETMDRQLGQLVRLVDDLLDISRITRNKLELRKERVELASVIHHAVEMCRPLVQRAEHEITVTLPPEPIYLHADPMRMAQVFGNLLNNACKYTEPKGRIRLAAERQGSDVVLRVSDTGIGIPHDMLPRIFEMFTQVDQTLERSHSGLGIGLALVKQLVEMHEGEVEAFSEGPGRGSEFVVRLPVTVEKPKAAQLPPRTVTRPATTARCILVVDDNQDSAASLALLLKIAGHETHLAHDGLAAVEAATRIRPDVVLLDIGLPKLNGYDACRRIREEPWGTDMLLVALTGWGQEEDRRRSQEAGFDDHMVKPVDLDALEALLNGLKLSPT